MATIPPTTPKPRSTRVLPPPKCPATCPGRHCRGIHPRLVDLRRTQNTDARMVTR